MNRCLKILMLVLLILPIWLTIVALAGTDSSLEVWKERMNSKLLENTERRIQISDLIGKGADFGTQAKDAPFDLDLSGVRDQGVSEIAVKFFDKTGRLTKLVRVSAKLFIQEQVAVARRALNSGDMIQKDDFKMDWRDVSTFRGSPIRSTDLAGRTVRSSIQENEVIYDGRIQKNQLISRGDRVKISIISKGLTVSGFGIAEDSGSKGQTVKVLNGDSRKEIVGIVTDVRAIEVRL
ncbi:MAG: Flagella basal body P-ring formation protein FlgA [Bacteriovoracaceae bacterium]|nr:Flagella basal body P-ring formation protein FlgA [Bacteriovoracaceae bacterium]